MRRLIKNIFLLFTIVLFIAFVSYRINVWSINKAGLQLCDSTETLMTGSSLIMLGLNPEYIPKSENVASAAEPVVISYFKIRDIIGNNPQVKRVITSCSLHEITEQDVVFSGKRSVVVEMFTRLSFLRNSVTLDDLKLFKVDYPVYWEVFTRYRVFPNYFYIYRALFENNLKCNYDGLLYVSGFQKRGDFNIRADVREDVDVVKVVNAHFPSKGMQKKLSNVSLNYLDSISALCDRSNIELIIVGMPISEKLYEKIPRFYINYYNSYVDKMKQRLKCRFFDFTHAAKEEWFLDLIHLDELGAEKITTMLNDSIKNDK